MPTIMSNPEGVTECSPGWRVTVSDVGVSAAPSGLALGVAPISPGCAALHPGLRSTAPLGPRSCALPHALQKPMPEGLAVAESCALPARAARAYVRRCRWSRRDACPLSRPFWTGMVNRTARRAKLTNARTEASRADRRTSSATLPARARGGDPRPAGGQQAHRRTPPSGVRSPGPSKVTRAIGERGPSGLMIIRRTGSNAAPVAAGRYTIP